MTRQPNMDAINRSVLFLNQIRTKIAAPEGLGYMSKILKDSSKQYHVSSMMFYIARDLGYFENKVNGDGKKHWVCRVATFEPFHAKLVQEQLNLYNSRWLLKQRKAALRSASKAHLTKGDNSEPAVPPVMAEVPPLTWGELFKMLDDLVGSGAHGTVVLRTNVVNF